MTVGIERRKRLVARVVRSFEPGSYVRVIGHRGVGVIESFADNGDAWIAWQTGVRALYPVNFLRNAVKAGSHKFDSRWPE